MNRRSIVIALTLAAAGALAHAQSPTGPAPMPALPRPGATLLMENARGAVWDVIYPPGVPTGLHRHAADFVGVELVSTRLKLTGVDGAVHVSDIPRGAMYMLPKGLTHIEEGVV